MKTPITPDYIGKRAKAKTGYAAGLTGKIVPNNSAIGTEPYLLKTGMLNTRIRYVEEIELVDAPVPSK